jgi:protein-S-isoprenylcysteine O-methyltransferase Ste14
MPIFKLIYWLALIVQIAIRMPYERRRRHIHLAIDRADCLEQTLVGQLFLGLIAIPAAYSATSWLCRADYPIDRRTQQRMGTLGTLLMAIALWLFYHSHRDLDANWSPSLQLRDEHQLVTNGVYRRIRHPMYASQWLWSIAQALLLPNWIAGWSGLLSFAPLYFLRVPREEAMMREQFGTAYRDYEERTGRIIPRPKRDPRH